MTGIRHRTVEAGELRMALLEAGDPGASQLVLLLHGFPELAHSWRHQLEPLAATGRHVVAPDLRGFGDTVPREGTSLEGVEAFDLEHLAGDVLALLDALGRDSAVVIGHDWGADLAWKVALMHPERVAAVAGLSVPYAPRAPAPPTEIMREHIGEDFYIVWFQQPGEADEVLGRDVRHTLTTTKVWTKEWGERDDDRPERPPWWTEEDLDHYVQAFERTGFTGGLNWYRNIDRNWKLLEPYADRRIEQPALFLTGSRDPVTSFMPHSVMDGWVSDLREAVVLDGAGHWVQQERPDEVTEALERFVSSV